MLQWGHAFSDVETKSARNMPRCVSPCFNGATPFRTWKLAPPARRAETRAGSFNGATPFRTWKLSLHRLDQRAHAMLQWGHAFSDVETALSGHRALGVCKLQWGHAFSDVETMLMATARASRSKLQWGHAFSDVETMRFNVCSTSSLTLQWGHAFSDVETRRSSTRI